jgi:SAM-dependent methyltransferase
MDKFFSGESLYGDDFNDNQLETWFFEESSGYADLGAKDQAKYTYSYHALNKIHGYRWLDKDMKDIRVLSIGGAYGYELKPIIDIIKEIYILEPSNCFKNNDINSVKITYLNADKTGQIPLDDNSIDLITCFGVLHHLPKIMPTIREMQRVLKPGGIALIREPCVSMGDWTKPRRGLTKNERGIPPHIIEKTILDSGLKIEQNRKCEFTINLVIAMLGYNPYNSIILTRIDDLLSNYLPLKYKYHATTLLDKIRPAGRAYVIRKPIIN